VRDSYLGGDQATPRVAQVWRSNRLVIALFMPLLVILFYTMSFVFLKLTKIWLPFISLPKIITPFLNSIQIIFFIKNRANDNGPSSRQDVKEASTPETYSYLKQKGACNRQAVVIAVTQTPNHPSSSIVRQILDKNNLSFVSKSKNGTICDFCQ